MLGLGRRVAEAGDLGAELRQRTAELIQRLRQAAAADGAERIGLVGTEALRQAEDGAALVDRVRELTRLRLRILSGEMEAQLSYLGGTSFRVPPGEAATLVDVGGGSTEVVQGRGSRPTRGTSLKLGSDRILRETRAADPPTARQAVDAALRISMALEAAPDAPAAQVLIATGGSAANLPVLLGRWKAFADAGAELRDEPEREPWLVLARESVERAVRLTARHPSSEVARRTGLSPERARLLAGGSLILQGLLDRYQASQLVVTERGLRDGVLLRLAAAAARSSAQG
ncbi:MAG: hypothetical protein ACRENY_01185 [Candidatus Dormibacteria bacterium]